MSITFNYRVRSYAGWVFLKQVKYIFHSVITERRIFFHKITQL